MADGGAAEKVEKKAKKGKKKAGRGKTKKAPSFGCSAPKGLWRAGKFALGKKKSKSQKPRATAARFAAKQLRRKFKSISRRVRAAVSKPKSKKKATRGITVPRYLKPARSAKKCPTQPKNVSTKLYRKERLHQVKELAKKGRKEARKRLPKVKKAIADRKSKTKPEKKKKLTKNAKAAKNMKKAAKRRAVYHGTYVSRQEHRRARHEKRRLRKTKKTTLKTLKREILRNRLTKERRTKTKRPTIVRKSLRQLSAEKRRAQKIRRAKIYKVTSKTLKRKREKKNLGRKIRLPRNRIGAIKASLRKLKKLKPQKEANKKKIAEKVLLLAHKLKFRLKQRREKKKRRQNKPRKFVEIGRIVTILKGCCRNSLAVIVDIIDQNWVILDGMCFPKMDCGRPLRRRKVNIKNIRLTHLKIKMNHGLATRWLKKLVKKHKIWERFTKSMLYWRIQRYRAKRWSTDLERWRVGYNRRQRSFLIKSKFFKLKKKVLKMAWERYHKQRQAPRLPKRARNYIPNKEFLERPKPHKSRLTSMERRFIKQNVKLRDVWAKGYHVRRGLPHA